MEKIVFALPGNEWLAQKIVDGLDATAGQLTLRSFPDGESYVRVISDVIGKEIILVCTLHRPDEKFLPLYFLSKNLQEMGAGKIILVAPYLAYMRQDRKFKPGEAVTSEYFAELISSCVDEVITIDPHLHRRHSLSEIYTVTCRSLHASALISDYIKNKIHKPLLIGPDKESEQWVSEVAKNADAPFLILKKERTGDRNVMISAPSFAKYKECTPVLVDDIISTARTMIETIQLLKNSGMKPAVCIGVHAVFSGNAFNDLKNSGALEVITCNTIPHDSNKIDISEMIISSLKQN